MRVGTKDVVLGIAKSCVEGKGGVLITPRSVVLPPRKSCFGEEGWN